MFITEYLTGGAALVAFAGFCSAWWYRRKATSLEASLKAEKKAHADTRKDLEAAVEKYIAESKEHERTAILLQSQLIRRDQTLDGHKTTEKELRALLDSCDDEKVSVARLERLLKKRTDPDA